MTDAESTDAAETEAEAEAEEQPEPFQNRAARRAKGKKTAVHTETAKTHLAGCGGTVHGPRQYGNRRSG